MTEAEDVSNLPSMWTVYDSPSDYPGKVVARRFDGHNGCYIATDHLIIRNHLGTVRRILRDIHHLTCLSAHKDDDPKIVEVWL